MSYPFLGLPVRNCYLTAGVLDRLNRVEGPYRAEDFDKQIIKWRTRGDLNPRSRLSLDRPGPPEASVISKLHYESRLSDRKGSNKDILSI